MSESESTYEKCKNKFNEAAEAINSGDLTTLKSLLESNPQLNKVTDDFARSLLQSSIELEQIACFDYLLSLEGTPARIIEAAFNLCLYISLYSEEYFFCELIKKGANVHRNIYEEGSLLDDGNTLLHFAIANRQFKLARLLIEKGVDINARNNSGCTPFHMIFHLKDDLKLLGEGLALMIYYGADPLIPYEGGLVPFEFAVLYCYTRDENNDNLLRTLFHYTYDSQSEYAISDVVFCALLRTNSPLILEVVQRLSEVIYINERCFSPWFLFAIEPEYLKVMIERIPNITEELLFSDYNTHINSSSFKANVIKNWEILKENLPESDVIEFTGNVRIKFLVQKFFHERLDHGVATNFIIDLLTYGTEVFENDFEVVYYKFGHCELFKTMLRMEIKKIEYSYILPKIIYDQIDLETVLSTLRRMPMWVINELLYYFAHPKLKAFCNEFHSKSLITKLEKSPDVPLLVELARDKTRQFLVERYNLKYSKDFYWFLNRLPISTVYKKILSFETKLYT